MAGDWLESLDDDTRKRAVGLIKLMKRAGAPDPEVWVRSEITEDIPQGSRFLILRRLWEQTIDPWREDLSWINARIREAEAEPGEVFCDAGQALKRVTACGIDPRDLGTVARMVAYEAIFDLLSIIDEGYDPEIGKNAPGWALMELDAEQEITGRDLGSLHETILSLDPSGRDGRPPDDQSMAA